MYIEQYIESVKTALSSRYVNVWQTYAGETLSYEGTTFQLQVTNIEPGDTQHALLATMQLTITQKLIYEYAQFSKMLAQMYYWCRFEQIYPPLAYPSVSYAGRSEEADVYVMTWKQEVYVEPYNKADEPVEIEAVHIDWGDGNVSTVTKK